MTTDNDPVDYVYVSNRLTRNVVQQHEAARKDWRAVFNLKGGPLSLGVRALSPDYRNRYDLAHRATAAVSQNTGDLASPGTYIRATLQMQLCKVVVLIGFDDPNAEVAGVFADQSVPGIGRVFVALFGSISNLVGWRRSPRLDTERHPSDAAGLYEILNATREPNDPVVDTNHLTDDRLLDTADCFDAAHGIAFRHNEPLLPVRPLEFLAVNLHFETGLQLDGNTYDAALLGAPLWVATPRPAPMTS